MRHPPQAGMAMVEALLASALLGLGLLAAGRLTAHALAEALNTRQQVQAATLAEAALDCVLARIEPCPAQPVTEQQGVRYQIQLNRAAVSDGLTEVEVLVQWRRGQLERSLRWRTRVSGMPEAPGLSSP